MAAGRPVVMVGPRESESARTIEREGIGHVIDPDELGDGATDRLVEVLRGLRDDPGERRRMGERARGAFVERYERTRRCAEWGRLIGEVVGR